MRNLPAVLLLCAGPAAAFDECLVGAWTPYPSEVAALMVDSADDQVLHLGGTVRMTVDNEAVMTITAHELSFGIPSSDKQYSTVVLNGQTATKLMAVGERWSFHMSDYDLEILSENSKDLQITGANSENGIFGGGAGRYDCRGGAVLFFPEDEVVRMPRVWFRESNPQRN